MKLLFTLLTLTAGIYSVNAQKADLDRYNFSASYRDLPRYGLDTSFKTFSLDTDLSQGTSYILRQEQPEERISIAGWRRLSGQAHISVYVKMEDINIVHSDIKERVQIIKDKNGKETARKYYYFTELQYTFAGRVRINDFKGKEILAYEIANRQTERNYKTKEFSSRSEAMTSFIANAFSVTSTITSLEVNRAMNELNNSLNNNFGYPDRTVGDYLWILDSKKHPEYKAHRQAWTSFKQAMFQMRADQPLDEIKEMLKPVISYFERVKKKYNSYSKSDRKIRYASYFNLAKIYYYLDNPDASLFEAGQLMINEYDEKDGRGLEAAAADLKHLLQLNKTTTRHFPLDTEELQGPSLVSTRYNQY